MPQHHAPVTLVSPALDGLPGQARYVEGLLEHLPGRPTLVALGKPTWAHAPAARTLAAWASYPLRRPGPPDGVVHGTDTFCTVPGVDVVTVHDLIPLLVSREPLARLHARLFGRRLRRAQVITLTRTWADRIQSALGVPAERLHVIAQGCSVARPARPRRPQAFGDDGKRIVLCVGAYRPYKRVHELVAAAARLPDVRVVRMGPRGHGPYYQACLDAVRRTGCDFVDAGPVPDGEVGHWYAAAHLVVYASQEEGFGFPPLEAMACGTTSLVSDIPVFRELYGDHVRYAHGDLAADLQAALQDPLPAHALQAHAARFTWEATARQTAHVHRLAAEDRASRPSRLALGAPTRNRA